MRLLVVLSIGALAFGGVWLYYGEFASSTGTKKLADGRALYLQYCASCHGINLEGQPDWRRRKTDGRLPAPPHDATGHTWHHPDEVLLRVTKLGTEVIVGGDYKSDMPGFGEVLTDGEINAIITYIKSTWPDNIRARQDRISKRHQEANQ